MTPNFFCISGTSNSLSHCNKNFKTFYWVENFRANVLKVPIISAYKSRWQQLSYCGVHVRAVSVCGFLACFCGFRTPLTPPSFFIWHWTLSLRIKPFPSLFYDLLVAFLFRHHRQPHCCTFIDAGKLFWWAALETSQNCFYEDKKLPIRIWEAKRLEGKFPIWVWEAKMFLT